MKHNFKIDFKNKKISYEPKGGAKTYTAQEFYVLIQDMFDEPENMKYEIPIIALSKDKFKLINGWTIDKKSLTSLKGELQTA